MVSALILAIGLYLELYSVLAAIDCSVNTWTQNPDFGPDCKYMCRCKDNERCDVITGECPGQCQPGYMGTACQYLNVAFSQTNGTKSTINDGDIDTCASIFETDVTVPIKDVGVVGAAIYFQEYIANATLVEMTLTNVSQTGGEKCPLKAVTFGNGHTTLKLTCNEPLIGQFAVFNFLEEQVPVHICEIQISAGRNLAYKQDTYASTNGWGGHQDYGVDGGHNNGLHKDDGTGTCIHSGSFDVSPWWGVNLAAPSVVFWIRIYNRFTLLSSDHAERLSGFEIHAANEMESENRHLLYKDTEEKSAMHEFPLDIANFTPTVYPLQYIQISLKAEENDPYGKILNLCEFEVYGDCPEDKCGLECKMDCPCDSSSIADKITGVCEELCESGQFWNGHVCKSNTKSTDKTTTTNTMATTSHQTGTSPPGSTSTDKTTSTTTMATTSSQRETRTPVSTSTSSGTTTTQLPGGKDSTSSGTTTTRLPGDSKADRNEPKVWKMFIHLIGMFLFKEFT